MNGNASQIGFHFLLDPRGTSDLFTGGLRNVDLIRAAEPGERGNKEVRRDCTAHYVSYRSLTAFQSVLGK